MSKTDETYVPLSRGIVEHLKSIKGMPATVYIYLLAEAKFVGPEKGILKKKISDVAADLEVDYKTIHAALNKLKGKYIAIKPAKNQHSLTEFKILKYKTVDDFSQGEQLPKSPVATGEATPVAKGEQVDKRLPKQKESTVENLNNNTGLQTDKKLRSKEGKELKKSLKDKGNFSLPEFINSETWQAYLDMRKSMGKKFVATPKAQELIIKKLTEFKNQGQNPNAILEQSIMNSWAGVFELKSEIPRRKIHAGGRSSSEDVNKKSHGLPEPKSQKARNLWEDALKAIESKIGENDFTQESFDTFFTPTRGYNLINEKLIIAVPSEFFVNWLKEHYTSSINEALHDRKWELVVVKR